MASFIFNTAVPESTSEATESLKKHDPKLLMDGESVCLAFRERGGKGRDYFCFTTERILIVDVQGVTGKHVNFKSIPYTAVKAFEINTASSIDADTELYVIGGGGCSLSFHKTKADIFQVYHFLSSKVLHAEGLINTLGSPYSNLDNKDQTSSILDYLGGDGAEIDPRAVQGQLAKKGLLVDGETVEMAFKCGRDTTVMTSKRLMMIDVKGLTGKKVAYTTIKWKHIVGFASESAGNFLDRDAEMTLYTDLSQPMRAISQELRKSKCDILAVQRFFSDKLLGPDTAPAFHGGNVGPDMGQGAIDFLGGNSRQVDPAQANAMFHSGGDNILQNSETVEMAFKGTRDMMLFTTKRLIFVDVKGFSGKKRRFTSLPWKTIKGFAVTTAGMMDRDSELMVWTPIMFDPPKDEESPPEPGMSFLVQEFSKDKVDLLAIHRYLSERIVTGQGQGGPMGLVSQEALRPTPVGGVDAVGTVLSGLTGNGIELDPSQVNANLHGNVGLLQPDEYVLRAYQVGRDMYIFTTKRVFVVDRQGLSGKKTMYQSIPYASVKSFAVQTAGGGWDTDAEVCLRVHNHWTLSKVELDLKKGKADPIALNNFLGRFILGYGLGDGRLESTPNPKDGQGIIGWLAETSYEVDQQVVSRQLRSTPPLLLPDEQVKLALKDGRDMVVYTDKRVITIDVKGLTGKRVMYESIPLRFCTGFEIETGGTLSRESTFIIQTSVPNRSVKVDVHKKKCDVFAYQKMMGAAILGNYLRAKAPVQQEAV